jgi:hypothetical protein
MKAQIFLVVQLAVAAVLLWCSFCRLTKTDADTVREVRWAFLYEMIAGGMLLGAPFMPMLMPDHAHWPAWSTPTWVWLAVAFAFALVQVIAAPHWAHGVAPPSFQRHGMMRRNTDYRSASLAVIVLVVASLVAWPQMAVAQAAPPAPTPLGAIAPYAYGQGLVCGNKSGCVSFTVEALRAVLQKAGGTCGRIPGKGDT